MGPGSPARNLEDLMLDLMFSGLLAAFILAGLPGTAKAPAAVWLKAADGVEIRGDLYALNALRPWIPETP